MNRLILIFLLVAGGVVVGAFTALVAAAAISPPEKPRYREGNVRIAMVLIGGVVGGFVGYLAADLFERAIRTPPSPQAHRPRHPAREGSRSVGPVLRRCPVLIPPVPEAP